MYMSLSQISERRSTTTMSDLDDEKSQQYQLDSVVHTALTIAELAKQLGDEQKSMQLQLKSIHVLEQTCGRLLCALQTLKESFKESLKESSTSRSSFEIQRRPAISLLTVE